METDRCRSCADYRGEGSFWKSSELKGFQVQTGKRERRGVEGVDVLIFYKVGSGEMLFNGKEIKDQVHYFNS